MPACGNRCLRGDDGSHHPQCEKVVQEFWEYDEADRAKAIWISAAYRVQREAALNGPRR